jgi:predicted nuclease of predicted toxin-antitoxin system
LAPSGTDHQIVEYARDGRSVVTQDLEFSAIVALSPPGIAWK